MVQRGSLRGEFLRVLPRHRNIERLETHVNTLFAYRCIDGHRHGLRHGVGVGRSERHAGLIQQLRHNVSQMLSYLYARCVRCRSLSRCRWRRGAWPVATTRSRVPTNRPLFAFAAPVRPRRCATAPTFAPVASSSFAKSGATDDRAAQSQVSCEKPDEPYTASARDELFDAD